MPSKDPNYYRNYYLNNKKRLLFKIWKQAGLIGDYELIWNIYINTSHCDKCGVLLQGRGNNKKCMDHCHTTGKFRNILCHKCNTGMVDKTINRNNKTGYRNINYCDKYKGWFFKKYNHRRYHKNLNELHWYKFVFLIINCR